ncbi:hypothetical protein HZH66_009704 [Vespula vulgaris]|uniref:Uncharacterized protein n=1 Tax=Vespula vulgaris TaxID=7454 RepID=A0A834JN07_VESVU|nr:hypothetical protein HZH66_009704 [Vespula vulgaris]
MREKYRQLAIFVAVSAGSNGANIWKSGYFRKMEEKRTKRGVSYRVRERTLLLTAGIIATGTGTGTGTGGGAGAG